MRFSGGIERERWTEINSVSLIHCFSVFVVFIRQFLYALYIHANAQKMKFFIKDLVTFAEEILNVKLNFLCSVYSRRKEFT